MFMHTSTIIQIYIQMKSQDFKIEYIQKTFIQEQQFYQWLQILFKLNMELNKNYNHNSADLFVVKVVQFLNEGKNYCEIIIPTLIKSNNKKSYFFQHILDFIEQFKVDISEAELDFLEYKRHNICHIFQNGYEPIQNNLKIKTHLKNRTLKEIEKNLISIISSEKDEFTVQEKLFKRYYNIIEKLRSDLMAIQKQYNI